MMDAASGHLDRPVPTCPGWDVAQLVGHLGGIYAWAGGLVNGGGEPPTGGGPEVPADRAQLLGWFGERREEILSALLSHGPEDPAWTFIRSGPHNVEWWARRQALETAVHRFDAGSAAGRPEPITAELSVEGIDEFLTYFLSRVLARQPVDGLRGTFHLHCTDADGEWSLDFDADDVAPRREHAKADTALRGPASGLYLWLWNRQTPEQAGIEVFGDTSVVETWPRVTM